LIYRDLHRILHVLLQAQRFFPGALFALATFPSPTPPNDKEISFCPIALES
jgi:hypothetical protein